MTKPVIRAYEPGGKTWDDPSEEQLYDALADMNLSWPVLVVERLDRAPVGQYYMRVLLNDDLSYDVECRSGEEEHVRARVPRQHVVIGVEPVAEAFIAWAFEKSDWRELLAWEPWQRTDHI